MEDTTNKRVTSAAPVAGYISILDPEDEQAATAGKSQE
jgi:hypothetical protein